MDKNDKVLCAVQGSKYGDFRPGAKVQTAEIGTWKPALFLVNEADKAGAVREDEIIKFRMVVHLYLPE